MIYLRYRKDAKMNLRAYVDSDFGGDNVKCSLWSRLQLRKKTKKQQKQHYQ